MTSVELTLQIGPTQCFPLPVFLNDGRSYVQGTQLLARAADWFASQVTDTAGLSLTAAAFHKITDQEIALCRLPAGAKPGGDLLGTAQFKLAQEKILVGFVQMETKAPAAVIPPNCTYERCSGEPPEGPALQNCAAPTVADLLSARYAVGSLETFEDVLVAVIQCIKTQHDALCSDVSDIWFTGIRSANIPTLTPFPARKGELHIDHLRLLGKSGSYQSMQRVTLIADGGHEVFQSIVSFAFKTGNLPNVN